MQLRPRITAWHSSKLRRVEHREGVTPPYVHSESFDEPHRVRFIKGFPPVGPVSWHLPTFINPATLRGPPRGGLAQEATCLLKQASGLAE